MPTILDNIVAAKREEVARAKTDEPESALRRRLADAPPPRDFLAAISGLAKGDSPIFVAHGFAAVPAKIGTVPIRLIAEVKKASPSKGVIRADFDPVAIARTYRTTRRFVHQRVDRRAVFPGQLGKPAASPGGGRSAGAAEGFHHRPVPGGRGPCGRRRRGAADRRMSRRQVARAASRCDCRARNDAAGRVVRPGEPSARACNRRPAAGREQSQSAHVRGRSGSHARLRRQIPADRLLVGESGIRTRQDALRLEAAGVQAMLVGESLLARSDVGAAVDELLGTTR